MFNVFKLLPQLKACAEQLVSSQPRCVPDRGIFIVFFSIVMVAFLALLALVLGLGLVSVSSVQLQNMANLAALSSLEGYFASTEVAPSDRAEDASDRANEVLANNRILGSADQILEPGQRRLGLPWGPPGEAGTITFGQRFVDDPDGSGPDDPCIGDYPCVIPWTSAANPPAIVNAAEVAISNDSTNPIVAPFARFFGLDELFLTRRATSTLVQRCTAYLLDLSISSVASSHPPPREFNSSSLLAPNSNFYLTWRLRPDLADSRLFAFRVSRLLPGYDNPVFGGITQQSKSIVYRTACGYPPGPDQFPGWVGNNGTAANVSNHEGHIWCNTIYPTDQPNTNNDWRARPVCTGVDNCRTISSETFPQDYVEYDTTLGRILVDSVKDPQPLSDFLLAFNAGLRVVREQSTAGDSAAILPFDGQVRGAYPIPNPGGSDVMTSNFDILVQLTNVEARGRVAQVSSVSPNDRQTEWTTVTTPTEPNFISLGWFPVLTNDGSTYSHTHIVNAIQEAIERLQTSCPASAKKDIIVATDGLMTCSNELGCPPSLTYQFFESAKDELLGDESPGFTRLLPVLRRNRIGLTTLLAGQVVQPNFVNFRRFPGGPFVTLNEASALGYGANFFDDSPTIPFPLPAACTDPDPDLTGSECAYAAIGTPGVVFREPNAAFGEAAFNSGGVFCPLMPVCGNSAPTDCPACDALGFPNCYEPGSGTEPGRLRDCARQEGNPQTCSLTNETIGAQAARCVLQAIGGNPYILVEN